MDDTFFGKDKEFWAELTTATTYITGLLASIGILLTILGATWAAQKTGRAMQDSNASEVKKNLKDYGQLIRNVGIAIFVTAAIGLIGNIIIGTSIVSG